MIDRGDHGLEFRLEIGLSRNGRLHDAGLPFAGSSPLMAWFSAAWLSSWAQGSGFGAGVGLCCAGASDPSTSTAWWRSAR